MVAFGPALSTGELEAFLATELAGGTEAQRSNGVAAVHQQSVRCSVQSRTLFHYRGSGGVEKEFILCKKKNPRSLNNNTILTSAHGGWVVPVSGSLTLEPCRALHVVSQVTVEPAGGIEAIGIIGVIALETAVIGVREGMAWHRCG